MAAVRLIIIALWAIVLTGCATFNKTEINTSALNMGTAKTNADNCVVSISHDDIVANTGLDLDQCISSGRYQAVLVEMPDEILVNMFRYTAAGHHGAAFVDGKAYRVQWIWAGVTGNRDTIPFKIRLWAIIEGMDVFNPNAHAVIMDARGNNAYDLHGNKVPGFSGKDYKEGNWAKLATLGESTKLGNAVAMFDGPHLNQVKRYVDQYATLGRVDFKDPSTDENFSIATPFNMTDPVMRDKMKKLAAVNNQYSVTDQVIAAASRFSVSPSPYGMALSAAFVAYDFVTLGEVTPNEADAIGVAKRVSNEYERFMAKLSSMSK